MNNREIRNRSVTLVSIGIIVLAALFLYFNVIRYYVFTGADVPRVANIAIRESNPSICQKVKDIQLGIDGFSEESLRYNCYSAYLRANPERNICPPGEDGCLEYYAGLSNQPILCLQLNYKARIPSCVVGIALSHQEIKACDVLDDGAQDCRLQYNRFLGATSSSTRDQNTTTQ